MSSRRVHISRALIVLMILALTVCVPAMARSVAADSALFAVTDLGTLGGPSSGASSINDRGQVVGFANVPGATTTTHAFIWQNGVITDLGTLVGGQQSNAFSINNAGQIAGLSYTSQTSGADQQSCITNVCHAVLWTGNDAIHDLGALGGANSIAWGINNTGQLAGLAETIVPVTGTSQPQQLPVVWQNGTKRALSSPLGGYDAGAQAINDEGIVVGWADLPGDQAEHCGLWSGTQFVDLGSLGSPYCVAAAINARDQVVGYSSLPNGVDFSGFEWQRGHMSALQPYPGDTESFALGISDQGLILGQSGTFTYVRAVVWHGNSIVDLNTLIPANSGWQLTEAAAMNASGQIVGQGVINGQYHAFLLTPTRDVDQALASLPAPAVSRSVPVLPPPPAGAAWPRQRRGHPGF